MLSTNFIAKGQPQVGQAPAGSDFLSKPSDKNSHDGDDVCDDKVTKTEKAPSWSGSERKADKALHQALHRHRDNKAALLGVFGLGFFE